MLRRLAALITASRSELDRKLLYTAVRDNVDELKRLLASGARINSKDSLGITPLSNAVTDGQVENIQFLLENGANPNIRDVYGRTALGLLSELENLLDKDVALKVRELLEKYGAVM